MSIGTKQVGDKIRDTPTNQPQQEYQSQFPSQPQGPKLAPPLTIQVTILMDKGSTTPLPLRNEEEQVQEEQEEETQKISTNEVLEGGKICKQPQQSSQDTEVRIVYSTDTNILGVDLLEKEKTLERSDKGKGIVEKTPSSSKGNFLMDQILRWLRKEVIRNKRQ